jgi:putative hemolysin
MRDFPTPTLPFASLTLRAADKRAPTMRIAAGAGAGLQVSWVDSGDGLREAQRLRYDVFATEMGANVSGPPGLDVDPFDDYCDHLLIRDVASQTVVGTYRVMSPRSARALGRLYAESEFDLSALKSLRPDMVEVGRSCVHRDFRQGAVILALWGGLGAYMRAHGFQWMLGCSSVPMGDGGRFAANLYHSLGQSLVPPSQRVTPHHPLRVAALATGEAVTPPALLKGYLRLGAKICGEPAWDPDFNCADFLTLLRMADIHPRYARHFFGGPDQSKGVETRKCGRNPLLEQPDV